MANKSILKIKCKFCDREKKITIRNKNGEWNGIALDVLKKNGWAINFNRLLKCICPDCNLFK